MILRKEERAKYNHPDHNINPNPIEDNDITLLRINVVGTPGFVIDGRRADCVEETKGNFFVTCSFDDGVEIDNDDDELDDDDVNGRCIGVEPLLLFPGTVVVVVVVIVVVIVVVSFE